MGQIQNLEDPELWWSRAQEARAVAAGMPDPDTTRIMSGIAQSYEQIARRIEVRILRRWHVPALEDWEQLSPRRPLRLVELQQPADGGGCHRTSGSRQRGPKTLTVY
jgi:hypothetical protein